MSDIAGVREWAAPAAEGETALAEKTDLRRVPEHTMVYEIEGPMFFGAAVDYLEFTSQRGKRVLILRMRNVPAMDISGLESLEEVYEICRREKITLLLSHVNPQPRQVMERAGFLEALGRENLCESISAALRRAAGIS